MDGNDISTACGITGHEAGKAFLNPLDLPILVRPSRCAWSSFRDEEVFSADFEMTPPARWATPFRKLKKTSGEHVAINSHTPTIPKFWLG
jgi:hypothetical protein